MFDGRPFARLLFVGIASLPACATGPSFEEYKRVLHQAAGDESRDCGIVSLPTSRKEAVECAEGALREGASFYVSFQVQGIDSVIYRGLVRTVDGTSESIRWDSDISGGHAAHAKRRIFRDPCKNPSVRDAMQGSPIVCEGD